MVKLLLQLEKMAFEVNAHINLWKNIKLVNNILLRGKGLLFFPDKSKLGKNLKMEKFYFALSVSA